MIQTPTVVNVPWTLDRDQTEAWLRACGDVAPLAPGPSALAPPMAVVLASVRLVAAPLLERIQPQLVDLGPTTLLHGDEEVIWHRPLQVEVPYLVSGRVVSHARSQAGLVLRIGAEVQHSAGTPVVSTLSSLLFTVTKPGAAPSPRQESFAPQDEACATHWEVAQNQPERYAAASGDRNPLHLDDALAHALGLERRPLHGMCSLAFAARSLLHCHGEGPLRLLKRLRARFRRPVYPGGTLTCRSTLSAPHGHQVRFGVYNQQGGVVIGRGAAELGLAPG